MVRKCGEMNIHGTGKYSDFVESFLHKWENFTFSLLLMKGGLQKLFAAAAGLVGRVGMPSLSFQPTIPDSIKVSYPAIS